jgi:predicted CXXCH cytochrome family protein
MNVSAMMPETGKERRSRIELDYYRRRDRFAEWRGWLALLVIAAAAGWLGVEAVANRVRPMGSGSLEPKRLASKGPLTRSHAMWDSTCEACHAPFTPIDSSRWSPALAGSNAGEIGCRTCHEALRHHREEKQDQVPGCAICHRDHRGRDASLLVMDDSACTRCHGDLPQHRISGRAGLSVAAQITRFDGNPAHHPEFTIRPPGRATDVRRVKFNHQRHLASGLTMEPGGVRVTYAQLAALHPDRDAWPAEARLDLPVQLGCSACHQLEGEEATIGKTPADSSRTARGAAGTYMLPVRYDRHCAACHPLTFDSHFPKQEVRHGESPDMVIEELRQFYSAKTVSADKTFLDHFVPLRPPPDRPPGPSEQRLAAAIEAKVLTAAKELFAHRINPSARQRQSLPLSARACVECHNLKPHTKPPMRSSDFVALEIEPVLMTPVWFVSAAFDHSAHRAMECAACHAEVSRSKANGDRPLLPGAAVCANCHRADTGLGFVGFASASAACTECHRYHGGDRSRTGDGVYTHHGTGELSADQFKKGRPATKGL